MSTDGITFKTVRNKWNRYVFFTVVYDDDNLMELDCDTLIDHEVHEGLLYLDYEENHKRIIRDWAFVEFALNKPQ